MIADLRGYGASSAPPGDAEHTLYSKRAMAEDCLALMRALGYTRFMIAGHDRGGRVAYRLALDHPQAVHRARPHRHHPDRRGVAARQRRLGAQRLPLVVPRAAASDARDADRRSDPVYYLEYTLASWAKSRDLTPFSPEALAHYRALMQNPASVHAICEDYRAGASIDRKLDEADLAAGRRIACPTLVL